jgi:DNA polymerase-3 subunit alpha
VLGTYISGHPLQEDEGIWKKNITNLTSDFTYDEETKRAVVQDGQKVILGGMIESKTVKYTKNGKIMAFLSLEDLVGTVEVIVWPSDYEKYSQLLTEDSKVFIHGRANAEEEKDAKLICEKIVPFSQIPRKIWIKFRSMDAYQLHEQELFDAIRDSDGNDRVTIYLEDTKKIKELSLAHSVHADRVLSDKLSALYGKENVKIV